jgi:hypothetical protein
MAEFFAAIGAASSILHLIVFIAKVIHRFDEFQVEGRETPKTFQNFKNDLAVLQEVLQRIMKSIAAGLIVDGNGTTLLPLVHSCWNQIKELDTIITKTLPTSNDSMQARVRKIIANLCQEPKVNRITKTLDYHIRTLTFYFVVPPATPRITSGTAFSNTI